jgi:hypothetical protein
MEVYEIKLLNPMQKNLLEHALQFAIDAQHDMGAITPAMASDLAVILNKIKPKGEYVAEGIQNREKPYQWNEHRPGARIPGQDER